MSNPQATPTSVRLADEERPYGESPRRLPWVQHGDFVHPDMYLAKMDGGWMVSVTSRPPSPGHSRKLTRFLLACDPDTNTLTPESAAKLLAIMNDQKVDDAGDRF